jgi:tyrosyl-DNA phosphodiesterase 2
MGNKPSSSSPPPQTQDTPLSPTPQPVQAVATRVPKLQLPGADACASGAGSSSSSSSSSSTSGGAGARFLVFRNSTVKIPAYYYNSDRGHWQQVPNPELKLDADVADSKSSAQTGTGTGTGTVSTLKIITQNIWFDRYEQHTRYTELLKQLNEADADVICLQEVIKPFLQLVTESDWIRERYFISDVTGYTLERYGVMILTRLPVDHFCFTRLPTQMGRSLIHALFELGDGKRFGVATVHFESLGNRDLRAQQISIAAQVLDERYDDAVLCGDFNFDSDRNFARNDRLPLENAHLIKSFPRGQDVWAALNPNDAGKTFDSTVNRMIRHHEVMRYDRFMLTHKSDKAQEHNWQATDIALFGDKRIKFDADCGRDVFLSDHFGLVLDLQHS